LVIFSSRMVRFCSTWPLAFFSSMRVASDSSLFLAVPLLMATCFSSARIVL
jgi:hypothetical protein